MEGRTYRIDDPKRQRRPGHQLIQVPATKAPRTHHHTGREEENIFEVSLEINKMTALL